MLNMKKKLSEIKVVNYGRFLFNRVVFELNCILYDIFHLFDTYKKSKNKKTSPYLFICSRPFYDKKKWQVVSQAELWYRFVKEENVLICGSFISYYLFGRQKDYVISLEPKYNAPLIRFTEKHKKVLIFISDSHSKIWLSKYIINNNITHILTPYRKTLIHTGYFKPLSELNIYSFPWCVSDHLLDDINIESRDKRVLGFGQIGGDVYDLRAWSFNSGLLTAFNYAGSGYKKFSGDAYYKWVRGYDACVVAMSSHKLYNYTVAKYFEIPSQGVLLFAFKSDDLEEFGFKENINYISLTKDNFEYEIKSYMTNFTDSKYLVIRNSGFKLIKEKHTVSKRIQDLINYINH